MVTTRHQLRKRKSPASDGNESPNGGGDDSSALAPGEVSPPKRQKLPVRAKDGPSEAETSSNRDAGKSQGGNSSSPAPGKTSVVVEIRAKTDEDENDVEEVEDGQEIITGAEQPAPEPEIEEASSEGKPEGEGESGDAEAEEEEEVVEAVGELAASPSISEPDSNGSGSDSDSDDAPEAVSTTKAAAQAFQSAKAANKATADQAKADKRKRQERAARLQDQAQHRKAAAAAATPQKSSTWSRVKDGADFTSDADDEGNEVEGMAEITPRTQLTMETDAAAARKRKRASNDTPNRVGSTSGPSLLPAEFLESDSEDDGDAMDVDGPDAARSKKPRTLKSATHAVSREARAAAAAQPDRVVGSTVYRTAAKKQDERLALKGSKDSSSMKRNLLVRGRSGLQQRPKMGGKKGFFVK